MSKYRTLAWINIKLLLRNKGFLFFALIMPTVSLLLLNTQWGDSEYEIETGQAEVHQLEQADSRVVYLNDSAHFSVKVYDSSGSAVTSYILEQLADQGIFNIYRVDSTEMNVKEIEQTIRENVLNDRIGALLYFGDTFESDLLSGSINHSMKLYRTTDDERLLLLEDAVKEQLKVFTAQSAQAGQDLPGFLNSLEERNALMPQKKVEVIHTSPSSGLNARQINFKTRIGLSFSIMTLAFLYCGVFIAGTVIEEKENRVYTRMKLSKCSRRGYLGVKLLDSLVAAIIIAGITALMMPLIVKMDIGIAFYQYIMLIFFQGLIFVIMSLCLGMIIGNLLSTNYTAFMVWSVSCLLAGVYFPQELKGVLATLSMLVPQKWFLDAAEEFILNSPSGYVIISISTVSFLIIILSIGAAGLRLKREG